MSRPKVVVLGMMTKMPVAGVVWQTVHYLLGFERLGYETYYVEAHARTPTALMRHEHEDGSARAAAFIDGVMKGFDLAGRWAFHALHDDGRVLGMSDTELREVYRDAAAIINLHGGTQPRPEHYESGRLVYLETDPVQLQVELHDGVPETVAFLEPHCAFFTFGENIGAEDCGLPVDGRFGFRRTRQPVVLDLWDRGETTERERLFTTIGNWRQPWRDVHFDGRHYSWTKHERWLRILDLPKRCGPVTFELALASYDDDDRALLESHGWRVRPAASISGDISSYREYISASTAELTVAKEQNVSFRTGWFSDRSASYLAAGRPVVTEDTGFGAALPTGSGLYAFQNADDAADAVEQIVANYRSEAARARAIAEEYFDARVVLGRLLGDLGMEAPGSRSWSGNEAPAARRTDPLNVLLVSHRFPPDALAGVERYTETLAEELRGAGDNVTVLTRRPGGEADGVRLVRDTHNGIPVLRITGGEVRRDRFLRHGDAVERLFHAVWAERPPDVVHFNHVIDLSPQLILLAKSFGAATVVTLHDYYFACPRITLIKDNGDLCDGPDGGRECVRTCYAGDARSWGLRAAYFRRVLELADKVVCPSEHVATVFDAIAPLGGRLVVVPNGVRVDGAPATRETSYPSQRGRMVLAFFGAVIAHKGVHVLVEALRRARFPHVDLNLFGMVDDEVYARAVLDAAAEVPGLRVRCYGSYDSDELALLLDDTDCVVVPSQWHETFGLVVREALAYGVPVVASRVGALADDIRDGVNGFGFDFRDPDELARLLTAMHDDESLLRRLRDGAVATRPVTTRQHSEAIRALYELAREETSYSGRNDPNRAEVESLRLALTPDFS